MRSWYLSLKTTIMSSTYLRQSSGWIKSILLLLLFITYTSVLTLTSFSSPSADITTSMTPTSPTPTPSLQRLCLGLMLCPLVVVMVVLRTADGGVVEDRFQAWLNTRKYWHTEQNERDMNEHPLGSTVHTLILLVFNERHRVESIVFWVCYDPPQTHLSVIIMSKSLSICIHKSLRKFHHSHILS